MSELTIRFKTQSQIIDPELLKIQTNDSTNLIREGRDWLDQRDAERAIKSGNFTERFFSLKQPLIQ